MNQSYQLIFEKSPLPTWVSDAHTLRLLAVNEAAMAHYGYDKPEFLGLSVLDLHQIDDWPALREHLKLPMSEQAIQRICRHKKSNGAVIEVQTWTRQIELDGIRAHLMTVSDAAALPSSAWEPGDLPRRLTETIEGIAEAFFTLNRDWQFTYVNARAEHLLEGSRDQLLGSNVWDRFPGAVGSVFQDEFGQAMVKTQATNFSAFYGPNKAWVEVDVYPSAQGLAVFFRDVTDRHDAVQHMHEERDTFSAVLNSTSDAIISIDVDGRIRMFNPGAERIFRRTQADMVGENIGLLMPERFRAAHLQHQHHFAKAEMSSRMMGLGLVKGLRSDGLELDLEGTISQVVIRKQLVLMVSLRDVTERVRSHQELQQSKAQLTELTAKLLTQEKVLIKRLSQVLHDQLGQTMTAIRMVHETILASQRDKLSPEVQRLEQQLGILITQSIRQIRQVLIDLRPPLLEEQGLAAALDNELRNRSLTKPEIDIAIHISPELALMRWPGEVEYAAFMIAREAIENSLRHSGASSLSVCLSGRALALHLEVVDNGLGMPEDASQKKGHLGILGMHERANAIGAKVKIESTTSQGTRVSVDWEPAV